MSRSRVRAACSAAALSANDPVAVDPSSEKMSGSPADEPESNWIGCEPAVVACSLNDVVCVGIRYSGIVEVTFVGSVTLGVLSAPRVSGVVPGSLGSMK